MRDRKTLKIYEVLKGNVHALKGDAEALNLMGSDGDTFKSDRRVFISFKRRRERHQRATKKL